MRVVQQGAAAALIPIAYRCVGVDGRGGCQSILDVNVDDLFRLPYERWYSQSERVAFECPCCRALTCVDYTGDRAQLPKRAEFRLEVARRRLIDAINREAIARADAEHTVFADAHEQIIDELVRSLSLRDSS